MGNLSQGPDGKSQRDFDETEADSVPSEIVSETIKNISEPGSESGPSTPKENTPGRTIRIRFLDQLSPEAQQKYQDEQDRKREEKKSEIEASERSLQESTKVGNIVEQPASIIANQTADYTEYNRVRNSEVGRDVADIHDSRNQDSRRREGSSWQNGDVPRRVVDIHASYREQELIIQSRLYESDGGQEPTQNGYGGTQGGGYQNPVFDLEYGNESRRDFGNSGRRDRRPRRWSFRRSNSGRFESGSGRVCPVVPTPPKNGLTKQYEYLEQQQTNYRSFTVEQQMRYGILPNGETVEMAALRESQNGDLATMQLQSTAVDSIPFQNLQLQDQAKDFSMVDPNLNNYKQTTIANGSAFINPSSVPNGTALPNGVAIPNGSTIPNGCTIPNGSVLPNGVIENNEEIQDENCNYDYSSVPMAGLPMIGALMGMCLGGPVGFLAGVKIGGLAAVGGSILGYTGASVVSEHKELREYIDEHYEKEPELYVQSPREEALNKRRTSRTLPETPGVRPLGSAKYRNGPNGYRRPSLVRASSFEQRNVNIRASMTRTSSIEQRGYRPNLVRTSSIEQGHRKLPSRPSFSRMSSIDQGGQRRAPLLRNNSNLHRKMSYRQSNNNHGDYQQSHHRNFRRYGPQTEAERRAVMALIASERNSVEQSYLLDETRTQGTNGCDRRSEWSRADFHRSTSLESRDVQFGRERQRYLVRQESVTASSLPDLLE